MSEQQSPETVDDPFGTSDVASMEDILASIRSMIADDESAPELPTPPPEPLPVMESPAVEPVADLGMDLVSEAPDLVSIEPATPSVAAEPASEPMLAEIVTDDSLDLDALFDNTEDLTIDMPAETAEVVSVDATIDEAPLVPLAGSEDIDLVKSLMAALSTAPANALATAAPEIEAAPSPEPIDSAVDDDPAGTETLEEVLELDETWFSGDLSIPDSFEEVAPETAHSKAEPVASPVEEVPDTSAMLDDILDSTIASEEALNAAEISASESDVDVAAEPADETALVEANVVSLASIAACAEQDADALEAASVATDFPAPVADGDIARDTPAEVDTPEDLVAELVADVDTQPEPAPVMQADLVQALEEEVMARTAPLEEMIDDEVEVEAHNAFAELNRLVEEKNVYEERGPRIGDLVQEALKPMLKEWLDENLKGIVERAVQKEVKRISSGK